MLARALGALRERAVFGGDGFVITDPWTVLDRVELPRECVSLLVNRYRCLVSIPTQKGRFRIVRETLPVNDASALPPAAPSPTGDAPTPSAPAAPPPTTITEPARAPRFLLILDVENVLWTHRGAGLAFEPSAIRDRASAIGTIAFAFAYGNLEKIPPRARENLTMAGFPLIHCQRLRDGNGGKDTVDEHIQDLIRRFLDCGAVDGVILVTDDRNFAPIMRGVLDAGKRLIRFTLRAEAMLDQIGEVRRLLLESGNGREPVADRRWAPEPVIEDLRLLPAMPREEWGPTIRRIQLRAPLVSRFLHALLRRCWGRLGEERTMHFPSLVTFADDMVRAEDRADISRDDLWSFCSALNEIGVFLTISFTHEDGSDRRAYRPDWNHPFCAEAIADIKDRPRDRRFPRGPNDHAANGGADRPMRPGPPSLTRLPKARYIMCGADGITYRVSGARTRDDALAAVRARYVTQGATDETLAAIAAIGSPRRGTPTVEISVNGVLDDLAAAFDRPQGDPDAPEGS